VQFTKECGREIGVELMSGAYDMQVLPHFETAADIQYTKEAGAIVTGASTVPEQVAAAFLGLKCLGLAAVSNPATGTIDGWVHEQEFYLHAAKKCLALLKNIIWKVVEKFELNPAYKLALNYTGVNSLRLKQHAVHADYKAITEKISESVNRYSEGKEIKKVLWFMSEQLYSQYAQHNLVGKPTYFLTLRNFA
jgi:Phosphorylase superfamily